MQHDPIKDLFDNYAPELTPADQFLSRVERDLDAVEFIRRRNAAALRCGRIALAVAALVGCVTGYLLSLLMPWLGGIMVSLKEALPDAPAAAALADHYSLIAWLIIGSASAILAFNSYDLTSTLLTSRHRTTTA